MALKVVVRPSTLKEKNLLKKLKEKKNEKNGPPLVIEFT